MFSNGALLWIVVLLVWDIAKPASGKLSGKRKKKKLCSSICFSIHGRFYVTLADDAIWFGSGCSQVLCQNGKRVFVITCCCSMEGLKFEARLISSAACEALAETCEFSCSSQAYRCALVHLCMWECASANENCANMPHSSSGVGMSLRACI